MNLFPMHSWHPVMIHLPLVAFALAVGSDLIVLWTHKEHWRFAGTGLWWSGIFGAAAAVATGLIAYGRVSHSDIGHAAMTLHRNVALAAVALLLASAIWRWRRPFSRGAAGVGLVAVLGLMGAGYLGGELVYSHGIGLPTETLERVMDERGGHGHAEVPLEHGAREPSGMDSAQHEHADSGQHEHPDTP